MPQHPRESTAAEREKFLLDQIAALQAQVKAATTVAATSDSGTLTIYAQPAHLENLHQAGIIAEPMPERLFMWRQKADSKRNRAEKDVYLSDIGALVICRVTGTGATAKVAAAYGLGGSFSKPMPVDTATLVSLRALLTRQPPPAAA